MSDRNTVLRAMHDLGASAWFGGSLMGAVGLNGAASDVADPTDRARVAAAGWARWAPVNAAAVGVHLVGGLGLLVANRGRIAAQSGAGANTTAKTALTVVAAAVTAYSGALGAKAPKPGRLTRRQQPLPRTPPRQRWPAHSSNYGSPSGRYPC